MKTKKLLAKLGAIGIDDSTADTTGTSTTQALTATATAAKCADLPAKPDEASLQLQLAG